MSGKFLVINAGSSSLKFALYVMPEGTLIVNGYIEKIGNLDSFYTLKWNEKKEEKRKQIENHTEALQTMFKELLEKQFIKDISEIQGIGHRVLHGGEFYSNSVIIDDKVLQNIKSLTKLGPLHHPGEIAGIESMKKLMPDVPQVAVFDTAFHQTMPQENFMYAVPIEWYRDNSVRKYGFHGTSHKYITESMQEHFKKKDVNLIICHIGSGASICAVKDGKCHNTTMGLTPLDGLVMGTRCGTIDSSVIEYICKERNLSVEEVNHILNKNSGLLGIAGKNDFRDIEELANNGDEMAQLAIKMLRKSIVNFIAQYFVELNGELDAIVFTAGIGENAITLRADIINSISNALGVELDSNANNSVASFKDKKSGVISTIHSKFQVIVMPTNEEYMILKDTFELSQQLKEKDIPKSYFIKK